MTYAGRVLAKLGPYSETQWFPGLLREWYATGNMEDTESANEECDVCGHENIRYLFEIRNQRNGNVRPKSGSKCILKFEEIGVRVGERIVYAREEKEKALHEFIKRHRAAVRKQFAGLVWSGLQGKEAMPAPIAAMCSISANVYHHAEENGLLTPRQFSMFVWAARIAGVPLRILPFQGIMNLRKGWSKDQLGELHARQIEDIRGALTPSQLAILGRERRPP